MQKGEPGGSPFCRFKLGRLGSFAGRAALVSRATRTACAVWSAWCLL